MPERKVIIASRTGLHARPAATFVKAAGELPVPVLIGVGDGRAVRADSLLSVLSLGARKGTEVTLRAQGDGAEEALTALGELLARDLDADETAPT